MKIINLTPHQINIYRADNELLISLPKPNEEDVARVNSSMMAISYISQVNGENIDPLDGLGGIAEYIPQYGDPSPIPDEKRDTIYVVSMLYKSARPDRKDLRSPGTLIRDDAGRPIGCLGLCV
jgi:hypothetical protein